VVRVPSDSALVEDKKEVRSRPFDGPVYPLRQFDERLIAEPTVAIVKKFDVPDSEFVGRGDQLIGSNAPEFGGVSPECRRLTVREADHRRRGSRFGESSERRAESETLVIGVRAHGQDRASVRQFLDA
jgi:hypothetical protein